MTQHNRHPETVVFIKNGDVTHQTDVQFNSFEDGDTHCSISSTENIRGGRIVVKHYLYPNQNEQIIRLLFLVEALSDMGARHISVFVPYLPYARQDKAHSGGEVAAARILCRLLKKTGVDVLYNIDNHFLKGAPSATVEGLIIKNILVQKYLIGYLESGLRVTDYQMVGPDSGAAYLTGGNTMEKRRANIYTQSSDGSIRNDVETINHAHLHLANDAVVVADDMISTGKTMIMALQNLRERGIGSLYAMTSHGLFLKNSFEEISSIADGMVFSDTIPLDGAVPVVDQVFEDIITEVSAS
jgi:ribose-phosphate pyrophosphokinase